MGSITRSHSFVSGEKPTESEWNVDIDQLFTLVAGQLDTNNVDTTSSDGISVLNANQTVSGTRSHSGAVTITNDVDLIFGTDSDIKIRYDETTDDALRIDTGVENAPLAIVLKADQGDDAGDAWKVNLAAAAGVLTFGNDIASKGTYVTQLTLTPHATVASSTTAIAGHATVGGNLTVTGGVTVAGASAFDIGDSDKLLLGDSDDLTVYHDGSNSYITNATGALKIATETSGIAVTIGHTTSETTIADNATVTGTLAAGASTLASLTCTAAATFGGGTGSSGATITTGGAGTFDGILKTEDATDATSTTDGSLQTDGGLSVAKDAILGNDVKLLTDSSVLSLGVGSDATLTHDGTTGVTIAANPVIVDSGDALTLDAHTGIFVFKDAGTEVLRFTEGNSGDVTVKLATNAKDLVFTDNGDATNMKILDAAAGINVPGEVQTTKIAYTDGDDALTIADGGGVTTSSTLTIGTVAAAGEDTDKFLVLDSSGNVDYRTGTQVLSDIGGAGSGSSTAADDISAGDAAVSIETTSGNITIDAQANDADVIIKVDDNGSAVTALTLDGSDEGNAIFVNDVQLKSDGALLEFGADLDTTLTHTDGTGLTLNSTNKLTFGDAASFIQQSADGTLRIDGEAIIDLNASTRVDVSNDLKVDGDIDLEGDMDINGTLETDALTIGGTALLANDTNNRVTTATGSGTFNGEANLTFDGSTLKVGTSIAATADTDTSIGFPGSDIMTFSTGGVEGMRLNAEANLGIKTNPAAAWHTDQALIQLGTAAIWTNTHDETAANSLAMFSNNLYQDSADEWRYIVTDESSRYYQNGGGHYFDTAPSGSAGAAASFTNRLKIDSDGDVLIGSANKGPSDGATVTTLRVANFGAQGDLGSLELCGQQSSGTGSSVLGNIDFLGYASDGGAVNARAIIRAVTESEYRNSALSFYTQPTSGSVTERMRITNNGHLAVGQSTAAYRLEVINDHNGGWASRIINSGNSTPYVQWLRMSAASTTTTKFIQCTDNGGGDGNMKFIVFGDGDVESATNSYGAVSDVKLKQDIVDVRSYWDDFKAIRFRKFRFKTDVELDANAPLMYGVVAQELETVFPTLVTTHVDTENRQVAVLDDEGNPTYEQTQKLTDDGDAVLDDDGNAVMVDDTEKPITEEKMVDLGTTTKSAKYSILGQIGLKVVQELQTRLEAAEAKITALESA